jgi:glycine/D-amino acid oxidase-like deaminating enzyme
MLQRLGARVTLYDAWGPGNPRSSSGGDSRVIRAVYGGEDTYIDLVPRAFELWREFETDRQRTLLHITGALWLFPESDTYVTASLPCLQANGFRVERCDLDECVGRFPALELSQTRAAYYEEGAGYIAARDSCAEVVRAFVEGGGEYRRDTVRRPEVQSGRLDGVRPGDGSAQDADAYVFATGPWLGDTFPDVIGSSLRPTRQEVFYFGEPPGVQLLGDAIPLWIEIGDRIRYAVPLAKGIKIGDDTRGPLMDPSSDDRVVSSEGLEDARAFLERTMPAMRGAPLVESRVCQYESTPDGHFIVDRHPEADNVFIVGGGSGHGFKFGPVVGEQMARCIVEAGMLYPQFGLARLAGGDEMVSQFDRTR